MSSQRNWNEVESKEYERPQKQPRQQKPVAARPQKTKNNNTRSKDPDLDMLMSKLNISGTKDGFDVYSTYDPDKE